ncbi:MAG: serine/threonine-protein kinase [Fibrobacterota bacterium]
MKKNIPERIGKFRIVGVLGKGGMGDVYKGIQEPLNRMVALKILPEEYSRNEEFLTRFTTEATAVSRLEHQNIVGIYDFGTEDGRMYIAMRYVEGISLAQKIGKEKTLSVEETLDITRQLCRALKYAHEHNILHRDIKPQNILIGADNRVLLTDFGIAKIYQQTGLTRTGVVVGTPEYMSPEQAEGLELNPQTDIYSLGIVIYEMLTGNPPFTGDNPLSIAYKHVNVNPTAPSEHRRDLPKRLELVILKALKKDRAVRYKNIDEFLADLDTLNTCEGLLSDGEPDRTRGMQHVGNLKKPPVVRNDKRVVDRRSSDRRRELRRAYLRRNARVSGGRWKPVLAGGLLMLLLMTAGAFFYQRLQALRPLAGPALTYQKFVGEGGPERACDDNPATAWHGMGLLPHFAVHFASARPVNRIDVIAGDNTASDAYAESARPKKVRFVFDARSEYVGDLEDTPERQVLNLPAALSVKSVGITVLESYPGSARSEACLSELRFWHSPADR